MREYIVLIGFIAGLVTSMDHPNNFLFNSKTTPTAEQLQSAYAKCAQLRILPSKECEKLLSESLFILSLNWSDRFGVVGLILAKTLIEKGANPHYAHIEEEELETKRRRMIVSYTQTAMRLAKGKLLDCLKQGIPDNPVDE